MNTRNVGILAVVAVLVGGGIWYFIQSSPAEPVKTAEAPKAAAVAAPAPAKAVPSSAIAAPKAAPVPASAAPKAAPAAAPSGTNAESIKELDATITDMSSMLQAGDLMGLMEKYMPPAQQAQMTPEMKAQMQQAMQAPQMQQQLQMMSQALQSIQGQTPTFNDAGDKATYQMSLPAGMAPPGANVPPTIPVSFVKIDGRWYTSNEGPGF